MRMIMIGAKATNTLANRSGPSSRRSAFRLDSYCLTFMGLPQFRQFNVTFLLHTFDGYEPRTPDIKAREIILSLVRF